MSSFSGTGESVALRKELGVSIFVGLNSGSSDTSTTSDEAASPESAVMRKKPYGSASMKGFTFAERKSVICGVDGSSVRRRAVFEMGPEKFFVSTVRVTFPSPPSRPRAARARPLPAGPPPGRWVRATRTGTRCSPRRGGRRNGRTAPGSRDSVGGSLAGEVAAPEVEGPVEVPLARVVVVDGEVSHREAVRCSRQPLHHAAHPLPLHLAAEAVDDLRGGRAVVLREGEVELAAHGRHVVVGGVGRLGEQGAGVDARRGDELSGERGGRVEREASAHAVADAHLCPPAR